MKYYVLLFLGFSVALFACNQSANNDSKLQSRIDSLEKKLAGTYTPGFGEFMSGVQVHHAKLWFAGQNQNWPLAGFEVNEIKELLDGIKKYCANRPETVSIGMIDPPMDSISHAIQLKDPVRFKNTYILLTNTCNNCHKATMHEFNSIKIPDSPPFSNQDFKLH